MGRRVNGRSTEADSAVLPAYGDEEDVSAYTGIAVKTLQNWRVKGEGPPFFKVGALVKYRFADVDAWFDQHAVTPAAS